MTLTKENFSPRSASGSFVYSVLAHAALYGTLVLALGIHLHSAEPKADYLDLGYQEFDAPPVPEKKEHKVMRSAEPVGQPVAPKTADDSPKEMQDEKSDVAGTQKAQPVENNIGNTSNGDAVSTPYYKIKPKYPQAARVSGTEGYVLLEIDIKEDGSVENVRVVGGENRNMFANEARRAVEQWKYRPFVDTAGHPVRKSDHQVRVNFTLREEETAGT